MPSSIPIRPKAPTMHSSPRSALLELSRRIALSSLARTGVRRWGSALAVCTLAGASATVPVEAFADPLQRTIFNFTNGAQGGRPRSGLIQDAQGALYGTTTMGGNTGACFRTPGCGAVFKMTPPADGQSVATETVLYAFQGAADGSVPYAGLLMDPSGALYGATSQGGANGYGVVFKLTAPAGGQGTWTETTLFSFSGGVDGGSPLGTLVRDKAGALYGTTQLGGVSGQGVVFQLAPPTGDETTWHETVLYHFRGKADGGGPIVGLAIDQAGGLYGSTPGFGKYGFGVAFSLTPPPKGSKQWTKAILHSFTNAEDGSYPQSPFIVARNGALIGATSNMGTNAAGLGVVFALMPPAAGAHNWGYKVVFDFNSFLSSVAHPIGSLAMDHAGAIYGTSVAGGPGQMGVLYKLTPPTNRTDPWIESEPAHFFSDGINGAQPLGGVVVDPAGRLFGTTYVGGKYFYGAMFEVTQ